MSSIYFDNPLALKDPGSAQQVAWSKGEDAPWIAVAEGNKVRVFREEGEEIREAEQTRNVPCTALAWHPRQKVLVAGWQDGALTCSQPGQPGSTPQENREVHQKGRVLCLAFNPQGSRCVTTDDNGVVGVWKTERGAFDRACHYPTKGAQDKVVFRTYSPGGGAGIEHSPFFFGGEQGSVYLADDFGLCSERWKPTGSAAGQSSAILLLEYFHDKDKVVVITKSVTMFQFSLDAAGKIVNETKLKLSCGPHPEKLQGTWAGPGLLATTSHESIVRLWNLADDESYILTLQGIDERNSLAGDKATTVDFNPRKRVLAAGTRDGKVVQWRCSTLSGIPRSETNWQVLPIVNARFECAIDRLTWGPGENVFHLRTERSSVILSEAQLNSGVQPPWLAVQTAPMQVMLHNMTSQDSEVINAPFRIRGLSLKGVSLMVWCSKQVSIYEIAGRMGDSRVKETSTFEVKTAPLTAAVLTGDGKKIVLAYGTKIEILNLAGTSVRHAINFSEDAEGVPKSIDANGNHLVVATTHNMIRVWNTQRDKEKDWKQWTPREFTGAAGASLGDVRSVKLNNATSDEGTRVSLVVDQRVPGGIHGGNGTVRVPDSRIFVYDGDSDNFLSYSVGKGRVPVAHSWDSTDPRLMCAEIVPQALAYGGEDEVAEAPAVPSSPTGLSLMASKESEDEPVHSVMTLFAANSDNILLQDTISCNDTESGIAGQMPVGLAVPHVYFTRQTDSAQTAAVNRTVLRDFAGLEGMDPETTTALLDFSYHLACNNTDEAYKSVKNVQSHGVWESMSKMCVKTGRLDVAQKCLGQMGHARAASALRACVDSEPEAKLAIIAVHLDMVEDAEALYKKCGRFDLLNLLYQACGEWDKALEIAKTKDRVHLKPTHYSYAQHLEALEDVEGALRHFELSGTYRTESPRLLCQLGLSSDLEEYVNRSEDAQLHRWYAQYLESKSNLEGASQEYHKAEDWLSLCRVACFNKDINEAMKICKETQNAAACYHLARHLEADGMVKEAIQYFQKAGRLSHALRLAQENNFDGDLMSLALASDPVNMAQAAKYYEQRGHPSKAVQLYQKAGHQKRALELCFSAKLFDALRKIAGELSADSDPEVLARCAEFFMEHSQHDKAVHLLSMSHQFQRAIDLCTEKDVHVTEEMAEKMTPDKSQMDTAARAAMLEQMAKLCRKQGSFQLACKKFTQAGDKLKAMKCLLKSGDTEKIIFFAVTARQPDIYVLAGNYLQSLDWHNEPEIMKNIIQFYSKAKAHEKLAAFYDACAQVEIDEFRDYEKAGNALREALKYLVKAAGGPPASETDKKVLTLNNRIAIVDKFAGIRKLAKSDPAQMVSVCEKMLEVPEIETAVRIGDIFAQLVEHYAETQQFQDAHRTVERMRSKRIILTPYLDNSLLQTIYGAVGAPVPEPDQPGGAPMPAAGGAPAVEEDVHEDIEDEDEP